jgi:hypothetical protein
MNTDNVDFVLIESPLLVVTMIVTLFLAFGIAMDLVVRWLDGRLGPATTLGRRLTYGSVTAIGVVLSGLLLPAVLFTRSFCGCEPPYVASSFVVVTGVGTVLAWVAGARPNRSRFGTLARVLGSLGLIGTLAFGLARVVSDVSDIAFG